MSNRKLIRCLGAATAAVFISSAFPTSRAYGAFLANPAITANSTQFNSSFPVSNVFDSTVTAEYASQGAGVNTFIDFDFGATTPIDGFDIINRSGASDRVNSFNLLFSNDPTFATGVTSVNVNQNYTGVLAGHRSGKLTTFAPQTARYVRWDVTDTAGSTAPNHGATEMRFRSAGTSARLAPGSVTVTASSTPFDANYPKENASDGRDGHTLGEFASNSTNGGLNTFVDFDLGSTKPVTGFELLQRFAAADRATTFDLLLSNDPTFATGVTTKSYVDSSLSVSGSFAAVDARYIRYDVTGIASGTGAGGMQEMSFLVAVPEPGSAALLGLAIVGGLVRRGRRPRHA